MTRREAREQAFALMFEQTFHPEKSIGAIIECAVEDRDLEVDPYAFHLAEKSVSVLEELDAAFESYLKKWTKERISRASLTVLRLAICEMRYEPTVPVSVSINEAVELAKKYSTAEDAGFVNGVLGSIARAPESSEQEKENSVVLSQDFSSPSEE